jgi:DNA-binding winged helix-turn-helix (wHTH) protein
VAEVSPLEWQFGPFRLEANACCLRRGQETIPLQPKDGAVLHYLLAHAGRTISLDELLTMLWPESTVGAYVLRNCIARLRHALSDAAQHPRYIQTVPRQGYRFLVTPRAVTHGGGALARPGTPELVGREAALQQLHGWLRQALAGQHQLVRITGDWHWQNRAGAGL